MHQVEHFVFDRGVLLEYAISGNLYYRKYKSISKIAYLWLLLHLLE